MTFALARIAPVTNANVKPKPYNTLKQKPNDNPRSYSFFPAGENITGARRVAGRRALA